MPITTSTTPSMHRFLYTPQILLNNITIRSANPNPLELSCTPSCPICGSPLQSTSPTSPQKASTTATEAPFKLPCKHIFCKSCIQDWLLPSNGTQQPRNSCPMCRQPVLSLVTAHTCTEEDELIEAETWLDFLRDWEPNGAFLHPAAQTAQERANVALSTATKSTISTVIRGSEAWTALSPAQQFWTLDAERLYVELCSALLEHLRHSRPSARGFLIDLLPLISEICGFGSMAALSPTMPIQHNNALAAVVCGEYGELLCHFFNAPEGVDTNLFLEKGGEYVEGRREIFIDEIMRQRDEAVERLEAARPVPRVSRKGAGRENCVVVRVHLRSG